MRAPPGTAPSNAPPERARLALMRPERRSGGDVPGAVRTHQRASVESGEAMTALVGSDGRGRVTCLRLPQGHNLCRPSFARSGCHSRTNTLGCRPERIVGEVGIAGCRGGLGMPEQGADQGQ